MAVKYFKNAFAVSGDKIAVPNTDPGGEVVNYANGWTLKYSQDPNTVGYDINREQTNQQFFDITSVLQQHQQNGVPDFITSADNDPDGAYPYSSNAYVRYDDGSAYRNYASLTDANAEEPTDATTWQLIPWEISGTDAGAADALELNTLVTYPAFRDGDKVLITAAFPNTGATTLQVGDGLPLAVNIISDAGGLAPTVSGNIVANGIYSLVFKSGVWVLMNASGGAGFRTGSLRWEFSNAAISGWLELDDTRVGSVASNAAHAGDEFQDLFNLIWNSTSATDCPIFTSAGALTTKGASAGADWAANTQLSLPKQLGRTVAAAGAPGLSYNFTPVQVTETFTVPVVALQFTADDTLNSYTVSSTSDLCSYSTVRLTTTGALPTPLAVATDYYVTVTDETTLYLSASLLDAQAGIFIDITDAGSGVNSLEYRQANVSSTLALNTGTRVQVQGAAVPSGLSTLTDYYVLRVSGTRFQFCATIDDANAGVFISMLDSGIGVLSVTTDEMFNTGVTYRQGTKVQLTTSGSLPAPFAVLTDYYVIELGGNNFKLASTASGAVRGAAVSFTTLGAGDFFAVSAALATYNVGQSVGEEAHVQTTPELAAHSHLYTRYSSLQPQSGSSTSCWVGGASVATTIAGSSTAFNVMQPTTFYYCFIKL